MLQYDLTGKKNSRDLQVFDLPFTQNRIIGKFSFALTFD